MFTDIGLLATTIEDQAEFKRYIRIVLLVDHCRAFCRNTICGLPEQRLYRWFELVLVGMMSLQGQFQFLWDQVTFEVDLDQHHR